MVRKVYTARNGARYIKLANGQCRFVKGASRQYLNRIRRQRGGDQPIVMYEIIANAAGGGVQFGPDMSEEDHVEIIEDSMPDVEGVARELGLESFSLSHMGVSPRPDGRHHSVIIRFRLNMAEFPRIAAFVADYVEGDLAYVGSVVRETADQGGI